MDAGYDKAVMEPLRCCLRQLLLTPHYLPSEVNSCIPTVGISAKRTQYRISADLCSGTEVVPWTAERSPWVVTDITTVYGDGRTAITESAYVTQRYVSALAVTLYTDPYYGERYLSKRGDHTTYAKAHARREEYSIYNLLGHCIPPC